MIRAGHCSENLPECQGNIVDFLHTSHTVTYVDTHSNELVILLYLTDNKETPHPPNIQFLKTTNNNNKKQEWGKIWIRNLKLQCQGASSFGRKLKPGYRDTENEHLCHYHLSCFVANTLRMLQIEKFVIIKRWICCENLLYARQCNGHGDTEINAHSLYGREI